MIETIKIKNFKSIEKMKLDLGRVNVIIGANGSGKSNILEGIGMLAAAVGKRLDNEFLNSRGIRVTSPEFMRTAFDAKDIDEKIYFSIFFNKRIEYEYQLINNSFDSQYSNWKVDYGNLNNLTINDEDTIDDIMQKNPKVSEMEIITMMFGINGIKPHKAPSISDLVEFILGDENEVIEDFVTYSPENNKIRNFYSETQIEPLGIYGEGLFRLLSVMKPEEIKEIKENLKLIDWFEDLEIPEDNFPRERKMYVRDKYIHEELLNFDQRSTNEGFLFLLFYLAATISEYTPKFFAIDNIDNSLNPSLCSRLVKILADLARKYDKQIIMTTHNPAILDGLNLNNEDEKLFVVSRNSEGRTKIKSVGKPNVNGKEPVKLSEAFLRGYIGGLNKSQF